MLAGTIAARGGRCEVVGTATADAAGDGLLQDLAAAGVGHAAVLRTDATDLEPADLELALRYLPDARVIVLLGVDALGSVASTAAAWAGAALVTVTDGGTPVGDLPAGEGSIVLAAPPDDPDGAFAGVVADLAVRVDAGEPLGAAWPATLAATGADDVSEGPDRERSAPGRRSGRR